MQNAECRMSECHFALCILHSAFGTAAGAGLAPTWPPSKGGVLLIRRPGNEMACQAVARQDMKLRLHTRVLRRASLRRPLRRWRRLVGEGALAPPRLRDSRSVGSAVPPEPLARKWCSRPPCTFLNPAILPFPGSSPPDVHTRLPCKKIRMSGVTDNHSLRRAAL